jgi:hypothetical protein
VTEFHDPLPKFQVERLVVPRDHVIGGGQAVDLRPAGALEKQRQLRKKTRAGADRLAAGRFDRVDRLGKCGIVCPGELEAFFQGENAVAERGGPTAAGSVARALTRDGSGADGDSEDNVEEAIWRCGRGQNLSSVNGACKCVA